MFLKKNFGEGYDMVIVKEPDQGTYKILDYLQTNLSPLVSIESENGNEVTFQIPKSVNE